jgi:dTMP kinase
MLALLIFHLSSPSQRFDDSLRPGGWLALEENGEVTVQSHGSLNFNVTPPRQGDVISMPRKRGRLIAIEGIDQAGKRTQANLLAAEIRRKGILVSVWDFPDYTTPLGRQLKAYLEGRARLEAHLVHLLYAANRWEIAGELARRIKRGEVIIVNRYSPSNLAYGLAHGLRLRWLISLEEDLPKPDVVVLLDISPRTSLGRKSRDRDIHEGDLAYLTTVRREYLRLAERYSWKLVDGRRDVEDVRRSILMEVAPILR